MGYQPETPFDNIESAAEFVNCLLEASSEARKQVEMETAFAGNLELTRRKQALQLVSYKLSQLSSHLTASRRILNDLRTLRNLLLDEKNVPHTSSLA